MRISLLIIHLSFIVSITKAQFFDTWYLTTSYTLIPDDVFVSAPIGFPPGEYRMYEHTVNFNVATNLFQNRMKAGLHHNQIFFRSRVGNYNANISGMFLQYNFLSKDEKQDLNFELNYSLGNHCTCGDEMPYRRNSLQYYGFGFSYERQIKGSFWGKIGFTNMNIFNGKPFDAYNYTQYLIALQYRFKKRLL
jgi:hypothetical protein